MRIEFDPTNPDEATAVRAMLTAMHPRPTAGDIGIVMHEAPTNDAWHNVTTYTPPQAGSTIKVDDEASFVVPEPEVDSEGTPWDARIHSTPPTTNKDGTWRAKRGVTADQIAAVKTEREAQTSQNEVLDDAAIDALQEQMEREAESAPAQEQSAPPAPNAPVGEQSAPPAPPAPTAPQWTGDSVPENERAIASYSFLDVMKAITAAQKDGKIDTAKVKELCAAVGAGESTMGLNGPDNGDKRGAFMALLASETEGK